MTQPNDILSFWFDRLPGESGPGNNRKVWFSKDPEFDRAILTRFQAVYERAAAEQLNFWQATPDGSLSLILLLDQFPRNMFRGQPRSFATDEQALAIAQQAITQRQDQQLIPVRRWFVYLPFMHSEILEHQGRSVELFRSLRDDPDVASAFPYVEKHRDVIARFGRFPHRNAILNRATTPAEAEFLKQPGSSF